MLCEPLRSDRTAGAIADAVTPALLEFLASVRRARLLPNVAELPGHILDELANDLNAPWYSRGVSLAAKRELIRTSDMINMRLGTPWAVRTVAETYFGFSEVQEWWEYGAEPYHFRISTANIGAVTVNSAIFRELIERTKNVRSVFDGIIVNPSVPSYEAFAGAAVQTVWRITI